MLNLFCKSRDIVWADSISIVKLLRLFGYDVEYRPGTFVVAEAIRGGDLLECTFFLTARPMRGVPDAHQLVLPMIPEGSEHILPENVREALLSLAPNTVVVIGVSSPKQNYIAATLHKLRPDLTYHCLGAALSLIDISEGDPDALSYSRSGAEWIRFLQEAPIRTLNKLGVSLAEVARIVLLPQCRQQFREFAQTCQLEYRG